MSRRLFLTLHAAALALYGLSLLLVPTIFMDFYGVNIQAGSAVMLRIFGGVIMGNVFFSWIAREQPYSPLANAFILIMIWAWAVTAVVSLLGQLTGALNALGWSSVGLGIFWTAVFVYLRVGAVAEASPA